MGDIRPLFTRGDVAKILNVTAMTIRNREKRKQYPEPKRDLNGHRVYSLVDVFDLQLITYRMIDPRPVLSIMYDQGITDPKKAARLIDSALAEKRGLKDG